jgi:hypothetical protein
MKTMPFTAALIASLIALAAAQDSRVPQASLNREVNLRVSAQAEALGNTPQTEPNPTRVLQTLFILRRRFRFKCQRRQRSGQRVRCHRQHWRGRLCSFYCSQGQDLDSYGPVHR